MGNAIAAVVHNANTTAQVNQTLQRQQNEAVKNGQSVSYDDITSIASEVMQSILRIVKGESQKIVGLKEEEHYTEFKDGSFVVWTLIKVPKPT